MQKKSISTYPHPPSAVQVAKPTVEKDPNNIIIRWDDDPTLTEEEKVITRKNNNVTQFTTCSCGDKNLELWGLDTNIVTAENAVGSINGNPKNKSKGEHHFYFPFPKLDSYEPLPCHFSKDLCNLDEDKKIANVAVIDTGVNPQYFDNTPFLYDTSGSGGCTGDFGKNFTSGESSNVFDDHGHGTYVTKIITDTLKAKGIGYRILPLKVLDKEGKGSFWNVLCALSYLQKIQNEGAKIHLVNASLGGTMVKDLFQDSDFLGTKIRELANSTLVIASAGNENTDTDGLLPTSLRHYPSSYKGNNILSVGGHSKDPIDGKLKVHPQSNFGSTSIDLAAPYEIEVADSRVPPLQGTSFSTAYVTALAAECYVNNGNPKPTILKDILFAKASTENGLNNQIAGNRAIIS